MISYIDIKQGSNDWKIIRKPLWTGSRAIKLLQGKPLPDDSNTYVSAAMKRGTALEPVAVREYERKEQRKIQRPGFCLNSTYQNAGYSPDGIDGKILIEIKCPGDDAYERFKKGIIPDDYIAQIQFGLVITGLRRARLVVYNPDYSDSMLVFEIAYDKAIANNIRKRLRRDMKNRRPSFSDSAAVFAKYLGAELFKIHFKGVQC